MKQKMDKLSNNIWITKKSRINTVERLIDMNYWSQFLLMYYTIAVLGFSMWDFSNKAPDGVTLLTLISSIALFGISIFISLQNYRERALKLKYCHISLEGLFNELEILHIELNTISEEEVKRIFNSIHSRYLNFLMEHENHKEVDYYRLILNGKIKDLHTGNVIKLKWNQYIHYYYDKFIYLLQLLIPFLIPILLIIYILL